MFFAGLGYGLRRGRDDCVKIATETRVDTVVIRDTLRERLPIPVERVIVRVDTVWLGAARDAATVDTAAVEAVLPVERKVYATGDYRAVVEGFRPSLVEMEIYRNTAFVTRETFTRETLSRHPAVPGRWGIGLHAGYGLTTRGPAPYIGVGIQYNVLKW
jgi:hypothetical protein